MPSRSKVQATVTDKLLFVVGLIGILLEVIYTALLYLFIQSSRSQPSLDREITRVILRAFHDLDRFSVAQLRWAFPSSTVAYENWITAKAIAEDVPAEVLTEHIGHEGAKLHWVGNKSAEKVILYYHGGGYVLALSALHFNFNNYLRKEVKRMCGVEVKLAFLEYALLPEYTYPTQFRQAALALQHVLNSGVSPADIVIGGDSVGGQLALQILSHVMHPHPSLGRIQSPPIPLAGFLTISPWVIYDSRAPTFMHKDKDILSVNTIFTLSRAIRRGTILETGSPEPEGFWSEPLAAPPTWWRATEQATHNVLIVYGARELFTEDNAAFADKMRKGTLGTSVNIEDVEESNGLHIGPLIDVALGREPSETSMIIARWVSMCLES